MPLHTEERTDYFVCFTLWLKQSKVVDKSPKKLYDVAVKSIPSGTDNEQEIYLQADS